MVSPKVGEYEMIIIRHPTTYNSQMKNEIKRKQKDRPFQHVFKRTEQDPCNSDIIIQFCLISANTDEQTFAIYFIQ